MSSEVPPEVPLDTSSTKDDRTMAMLAHLGGIIGGFLVPLIIWLIKKESRFVEDQAKEALNFQITLLIAYFVGIILACFTFGISFFAVWIVALVFAIMGGVAANKGELYRYPINIRFIK